MSEGKVLTPVEFKDALTQGRLNDAELAFLTLYAQVAELQRERDELRKATNSFKETSK